MWFNKGGARTQILLRSPMPTSTHEAEGGAGKGKERKTENKTRFPEMGSHSWASQRQTARLLCDPPIFKPLTSQTLRRRYDLFSQDSLRTQLVLPPSNKTLRTWGPLVAWCGIWGWDPALLLASCLALHRPRICSVALFSHFLLTWCNAITAWDPHSFQPWVDWSHANTTKTLLQIQITRLSLPWHGPDVYLWSCLPELKGPSMVVAEKKSDLISHSVDCDLIQQFLPWVEGRLTAERTQLFPFLWPYLLPCNLQVPSSTAQATPAFGQEDISKQDVKQQRLWKSSCSRLVPFPSCPCVILKQTCQIEYAWRWRTHIAEICHLSLTG